MINAALRPNKTALLFKNYLDSVMNGQGGPTVTRNPDATDRGANWIRLQAMPYHQVNDIEFENPCMIHVYDLDEWAGLDTVDVVAAHILAAKQINVNGVYVSSSGIDIGYTLRDDPELIQYSRYQMTAFFCTTGTLLAPSNAGAQ